MGKGWKRAHSSKRCKKWYMSAQHSQGRSCWNFYCPSTGEQKEYFSGCTVMSYVSLEPPNHYKTVARLRV